MKKGPPKRPHGQARMSQVVTMHGPGAMVDLPDYSVIVGGLEFWKGAGPEIQEPRLAVKVTQLFAKPGHEGPPQLIKFYAPPRAVDDSTAPQTGIDVFEFPEWFVAQYEERRGVFRARPLVHHTGLVRRKFQAKDKKSYPVVPVRFVQACTRGHLSDIDWYVFVHDSGATTCRRQLWMEERGTSGDLADVQIRCDCGAMRSLAQATRRAVLGECPGKRPWLGPTGGQKCGGMNGKPEMSRLLIRSASNAYFSEQMSVISIPEPGSALREAVGRVWDDFLAVVESEAELPRERKKPKVGAALHGFDDHEVWEEINRRRTGRLPPQKSVKEAELEVLLASSEGGGDDTPEGLFYARALPSKGLKGPILGKLDRVVLVHRLREVITQVGFTRFQANTPDIDGELSLAVVRAPLAREATWLPAIENKGEGVFLSFSGDALREWAARPAVVARGLRLKAGFDAWKRERSLAKLEFPGVLFIMLHSLSHLLITALSLEAGYSASSIRERVYASESGAGILLFTGTSGAEGTLGGLVQAGRRIRTLLPGALELGRLCSNDPICAQHDPADREERPLLGAACHGCVLIAETACERRNELLDRALVVPTLEAPDAAFFGDL